MTIEDFEKLKNGVSLIENKLQLGNRPLVFLYFKDGLVITCCKKTPHHLFKWTPISFKDLSIYEPPKKKVKLYLYAIRGKVSQYFYSEDISKTWNGKELLTYSCFGDSADWVRLENTSIEVEV